MILTILHIGHLHVAVPTVPITPVARIPARAIVPILHHVVTAGHLRAMFIVPIIPIVARPAAIVVPIHL
jgi:hypothetical protein